MEKSSFPFYLKLSSALISVAIILLLLNVGKGLFTPLFFAAIFCIFLIKPCDFLEKRGLHYAIAAIICMLLAIGFAVGVIYFLSSQIISFKNDLPTLENNLNKVFNHCQNYLQEKFHIEPTKIDNSIENLRTKALTQIPSILGSTFSTLTGVIEYAVLVPIYTFLMLLYRKLIVRFILASFSNNHQESVENILGRTKYVIRNYIVGLLLEMLIVAIMTFIGLMIVGAQYAILIAFLVAILNLIPYLGVLTALILSVIITASTGHPVTIIGVIIVILVTHLIDSNILLPKVVGSKVRINALATIVGVVIGGKLWGIPGMFLAVPVIAIMKVLFDGIEEMKPWGILLGDDVDHEKKDRLKQIKERVKNIKKASKK